MFREIKTELQRDRITGGENRIQLLEDVQDYNVKKISVISQELKQERRRNIVLNNTVSRMSQVMEDMERRIQNLGLNSMKKSVVLSRFLTSKSKKGEVVRDLTLFFHAEM